MENERKYKRARKRVQELKGFYIHLLVYVLVNIGLVTVNLLTTPGDLWFFFPLLGWGLGLFIHFLTVFVGGTWGSDWEEKKIRELMDKDPRE